MECVNYDLIVIGGGPAGYSGAERAAEHGMRVALIEKSALGGVCLNSGCIPSKTFLNSAKILEKALGGTKYGVNSDGTVTLDHATVIARKNKVVKILVAGIKAKLKKVGVDIYDGTATVCGRQDGDIVVRAGDTMLSCKNLLVAIGSKAFIPPITGAKEALESGFAVTNAEVFDAALPTELVVIGGGVIGTELASYFAVAGSHVTILEGGARVLSSMDEDVATLLRKKLAQKGITIISGAKVTKIGTQSVTYTKDDAEATIDCDKVLIAVGRAADATGTGLENIGVNIDRGRIVTDSAMRAGAPNVYAAGDVNGISTLAHTAYRESEVAVNNMLGIADEMRYDVIPSVVYTSPEIASVGLTEQAAAKENRAVKVTKLPLSYSGRYVAENEERDGFAKFIFDADGKTLLGFTAIGPYAGEYVTVATAFIDLETDVERIKKIVFPHPTVAEIIKEGLYE